MKKYNIVDLLIVPAARKIIDEKIHDPKDQGELMDEIIDVFPEYGNFLKIWFDAYYQEYIKAQKEFSISIKEKDIKR